MSPLLCQLSYPAETVILSVSRVLAFEQRAKFDVGHCSLPDVAWSAGWRDDVDRVGAPARKGRSEHDLQLTQLSAVGAAASVRVDQRTPFGSGERGLTSDRFMSSVTHRVARPG